ncbi:GAF domain-like protein [Myxozyma melibiosi]|uniref:GAF domain-like protein n=1 Tax=Myxozyma melibiosi TaxID=54550 RepID=A0ABR1F2S2_9ASCO
MTTSDADSHSGSAHHADAATFSASATKSDIYSTALDAAEALFSDTNFWPSNLANAASLMWYAFEALEMKVNWAGFYICSPDEPKSKLLLGPFMGKVACQSIVIGSGVCGTAAATRETQVVPDVEKYPGHIACDGETKSEVVVPLVDREGGVHGVLDVDCLVLDGFTEDDVKFLEKMAALIITFCKF